MSNKIGVFSVKPLLGRDVLVGTAHLSRCRLDRDVLVIELAALPVDGCLYLPLHDLLTLHREQAAAALPGPTAGRIDKERQDPPDDKPVVKGDGHAY